MTKSLEELSDETTLKNLTKSQKDQRLGWFSHKVAKTKNGHLKRVNPLHLKSPLRYLFLSDRDQYETFQVKVIGFNKLDPVTWKFQDSILYQNGNKWTFRDITESNHSDHYPIAMTLNECSTEKGSSGLYVITTQCIEHGDHLCFLLEIKEGGQAHLIDYRNQSRFQVCELS